MLSGDKFELYPGAVGLAWFRWTRGGAQQVAMRGSIRVAYHHDQVTKFSMGVYSSHELSASGYPDTLFGLLRDR